jgi:hypothetical protein
MSKDRFQPPSINSYGGLNRGILYQVQHQLPLNQLAIGNASKDSNTNINMLAIKSPIVSMLAINSNMLMLVLKFSLALPIVN